MDVAEYKHVALGLIFLKYISDRFESRLEQAKADPEELLSNIPNMRHGGSLDWGTLQRQHALMLGGLCDSLVAFLFDVAWSRGTDQTEELAKPDYDDFPDFNAYLDSEYDEVEIAGSIFDPSLVLFRLDETAYDAARIDWEAERHVDDSANKEAAA